MGASWQGIVQYTYHLSGPFEGGKIVFGEDKWVAERIAWTVLCTTLIHSRTGSHCNGSQLHT